MNRARAAGIKTAFRTIPKVRALLRVGSAASFAPLIAAATFNHHIIAMELFDYSEPAELFACLHRSKRAALTYRRFATSAEAIQFAIEQLSPDLLTGSVIEVSNQRLEARQIRELYDSSAFPLERSSAQPQSAR